MNDLVRPSSLFGAAAAASLPSGSVGTVHNPPPEVTQLANGTTLRGVVQGQDGKGHLLIRTELGVLQVATKATPAPSTEVVLQIRSNGSQLLVLLMHAETPAARGGAAPPVYPQISGPGGGLAGTPPGAATGAPAGGAAAAAALGQALSPHATADVLALGQSVRAIVQAPPAARPATAPGGPAAAGPAALPDLEVGSRVVLRILSVAAPSGGGGAAPAAGAAAVNPGAVAAARLGAYGAPPTGSKTTGNQAAGNQTAGSQMASAQPPAGAPPSAATAPVGIPAVGRLAALLPHANTPASAASPASAVPGTAEPLQGVVLSNTHANTPVLQTPVGTLTLEVAAPLPPGSRVAFDIVSRGLPQPAAEAPPPAAASPATLAHGWPALQEALQVLQDAAGQPLAPGHGPAMDMVPQPGPRLASGLLFFLSALSAGDLSRWLGGQALQGLRHAGRDTLVQRLTQDFGQLGRMADAAPGDWRLLAMPIVNGQHVEQLRLWLRQHRDEDRRKSQRRGREATRFILEVELSELGDLQLDGLVHVKRFDLMLRSRHSLSRDMRREITRIFEEANAIGGYSGSIGFQASADWRFLSLDRFEDGGPALVV